MKKRNKMLALLLAMAMCCSVMAGCGTEEKASSEQKSTENQKTEETSEVSTVEVSSEVAEPLKNVDIYPLNSDKTFKVVSSVDIFGDKNYITEAMEKGTGVSIDWTYMTLEQLKLALSSKEIPDALFFFSGAMNKATALEYGQEGLFVNFADYLDMMPNLSAAIEENPDMLETVVNEDGSFYLLPSKLVTSTTGSNLLYYRTDMMKEIGWDKPPATTDEFLEYIKALQQHFGKNDPDFIAFNGYQSGYMGWDSSNFPRYFFAAFGELLSTGFNVDSNGKVVFGAATDQFKHYLEFMVELWNSGAFNTNIYSTDATASQALAAGNHVGVVPHHAGHAAANFASGNLEMDILPPLTSEYWDTPQWYQAPKTKINNVSMLSTKCEDIETMVKWFDAWYSTEENPLNEEGTIYGITPWLGEIGKDTAFDEDTLVYTILEHEGLEVGNFLAKQSFQGSLYSGFEGGLFPYSQDPNTNVGMKGRGVVNNLWPYAEQTFEFSSMALTQEESDLRSDIYTDISTYLKEETAKFITGEKSIEKDWDAYLAELNKIGLQDLIDMYQVAYERYTAK